MPMQKVFLVQFMCQTTLTSEGGGSVRGTVQLTPYLIESW